MLWAVTQHELRRYATFDNEHLTFALKQVPDGVDVPTGGYGLAKNDMSEHRYRLGHALAQHVIASARKRKLKDAAIGFDYWDGQPKRLASNLWLGSRGS